MNSDVWNDAIAAALRVVESDSYCVPVPTLDQYRSIIGTEIRGLMVGDTKPEHTNLTPASACECCDACRHWTLDRGQKMSRAYRTGWCSKRERRTDAVDGCVLFVNQKLSHERHQT